MSRDAERRGVIVEFDDSVVVPYPRSEAFVIADRATLADWNPAVVRSELIAGAALVEGRGRPTSARWLAGR